MNKSPEYQRCSAVNVDGQPCRAWAIRGSEPALCSVHAGRNNGGGAPEGNSNALKHGYYSPALREANLVDIEKMQSRSLHGELVLARYLICQLTVYVLSEGLSLEEKLAVMPILFSGIRTVMRISPLIEEEDEWDEVLDLLGEELGIDI